MEYPNDRRVDTFMELYHVLKKVHLEETGIPRHALGSLIATEGCKDKAEAEFLISSIKSKWDIK